MPSESETYEPLDPPDNESDTSAVKSGPSNLDEEEQEEELEKSEPRRTTGETNPVMRLEPSMMGKSSLQEKSTQATGSDGSDIHELFDEIYQRLDAKRSSKMSNDDFSQLAAQMAEMSIKVTGRQQECVGEMHYHRRNTSECICQETLIIITWSGSNKFGASRGYHF